MSRHLDDCEAAQGCALDPACADYAYCADALKAAPFLTLPSRDTETRFLPGDEPEPDDDEEEGLDAAAGS